MDQNHTRSVQANTIPSNTVVVKLKRGWADSVIVDREGLVISSSSLVKLTWPPHYTQPETYLKAKADSEALSSIPWVHLLQPFTDGQQDFHFIGKSLVSI